MSRFALVYKHDVVLPVVYRFDDSTANEEMIAHVIHVTKAHEIKTVVLANETAVFHNETSLETLSKVTKRLKS